MNNNKFDVTKDYYEIIGADRNDSIGVIKKKYREKSKKFHPDKNNGSKDSEEKFKLLNEAYSVLSNSTLRAKYHSQKFPSEAMNSSLHDLQQEARKQEESRRRSEERRQRGAEEEERRKEIDKILNSDELNWFFMIMPELKNKFGDLYKEESEFTYFYTQYKKDFIYCYNQYGSIFDKDCGFFQKLIDSNIAFPNNIEKLFTASKPGSTFKAKIPLKNDNLSGLDIVVGLESPIRYKINNPLEINNMKFVESDCIKKFAWNDWIITGNGGILYINAEMPFNRDAYRRLTPLQSEPKLSIEVTSNFVSYSVDRINQRDYKIDLSENCPKGNPLYNKVRRGINGEEKDGCGLWIVNLVLGNLPIIKNGFLKLNPEDFSIKGSSLNIHTVSPK